MPQVEIEDVDDGSVYDVDVQTTLNVGDVLLIHDPGTTQIRLVVRVTGRKGASFTVERISTAATSIMLAEAR
ncbi:MAG TPA: hypothetical protein VGG39_14655 [Polyangiaceae bacterium]|jgi:hypothetical protein